MHLTPVATRLMKTPTAPTREQWMLEALDEVLSGKAGILPIPGLEVSHDRFGNVFARVRRGNPSQTVAIVAHLDHPGFVVQAVDGKMVEATFEGGVRDQFFPGSRVRLYRSRTDEGIGATVREATGFDYVPHNRQVFLEADEDATGAVLGMWDLPAVTVDGDELRSRAVDDLGGCAVVIEALRIAATAQEDVDLLAIFTRAEECGFRGALLLCTADDAVQWLPRDAWVLSVETSSARPTTPIGGGAVLRVGDKETIFNPEISRALMDVSTELAETGAKPLVRALMDGGTCEATVFNLYGWTAGAVCVPLGNYHNMNHETGAIDSEYISVSDAESLARALAAMALRPDLAGGASAQLKARIQGLADTALAKMGMAGA